MLGWLRAAASSVVTHIPWAKDRIISLVSDWLAGALWLIDSTYLGLARLAYGGNAVAYACVRLLSQSIPEPPLLAYQEDAKGERTLLDRAHPLHRLIARPNELMTEFEFWELTSTHMAIAGFSPWLKQRSNAGKVIALWPLRPDRVGPIYSTSDQPGERVLSGYSYQSPGTGEYIAIPRRDVMVFNLPKPSGESGGIVEGMGPLQVLASEISADNEATAFVGALLKNYAVPSMVLTVKAPVRNEDDAKLIKAKARAEFGGSKRGEVALLDADTKAEMIGFSLEQLEFPDLRAVAESRIAAAVGVPAILVGLKAGLDRSTFSNFAEARAFFAETTLSGYWRRFSDQFTNDVAAEFGEGIVCAFDTSQVRALAGQRVEKIQPIKEAFEKGAATRNEYRLALGLDPDPNGDVYVIAGTFSEIPKLDHVKPQSAPVPPSPVSPGSPSSPSGGGPGESPDAAAQQDGVTAKAALRAAPDPRDEAERRLREALVAMFEKTAPEVARKIAAGEPVSDDELAEAFRAVFQPNLAETATEEGLRLGAEIGVQFDPAVVNAAAAEWAKQYTYELVKDITATTRTIIANATEQFIATPGMTNQELRDLLEPAFGEWRANLISTTETSRAYAQSSLVYKNRLAEQGISMLRVHNTSRDERVCPLCGPRDRKPETEWPDYGPPLHPGCRCSVSLQLAKGKQP